MHIALYSVFSNNVYIGIFTFLINYKELSAFFENLPKKILGSVYYDTFRLKKEQKTDFII
jgi:hypothetical protein